MAYKRALMILFLSLLLTSGCAPLVETREPASTIESGPAALERVFVQGSRVPRRVDPASSIATSGASPARVYSRQELDGSGQTDTAAALRELDAALGGGYNHR
ncbi:MAG: hypothetical protein RQ741_02410 [Wenzhouxiangellaceae bacterium]|nr:hypothetical protein [Wenzhouxiangellaceae bacterium]